MKKYVVDASVAIKWFVPEAHAGAASRLMEPGVLLHAPDFFSAEIGHTLWKKIRRNELTAGKAKDVIGGIHAMRIQLYASADLLAAALNFALALDHAIYDCLYLALAVAQECPFVTADARFAAAVAKTPHAPHIRWIEDEL